MASIATGLIIWAIQSPSDERQESKAMSEVRTSVEANALLNAAMMQNQYKDFKGAARTYRRVLELDPDNKTAWYNLGVIAQQEGRTADARAAYDKVLKIDPKYWSALYNKSFLVKSSAPDQALGLLKRAVAANPKAAAAHLQIGLILAERDRDEEAEEAFRRAVAGKPSLHSHVPEPFRDDVSPSPTPSEAGDTE
ncbi:tetratricopeptide repeat protein [Streptomyces sp. enrichment culture]|uniref:tetratricopeptide repeat protein n=1 Tax=Streptomyces sp. enrichment culture TaxID=1795815 RepID=UPI003F54C096